MEWDDITPLDPIISGAHPTYERRQVFYKAFPDIIGIWPITWLDIWDYYKELVRWPGTIHGYYISGPR